MKYLTLILIFLISKANGQSLITYPEPTGVKQSPLYKVTLTQNGKVKNCFVYLSQRNGAFSVSDRGIGETFNFSIFSFSGSVKVKIKKNNSRSKYAIIRPLNYGIGKVKCKAENNDASVEFVIANNGKFSVEFDDDNYLSNPIMIFADPLELKENVPDKSANTTFVATDSSSLKAIPDYKTVVYFQEGVTDIGRFRIPPSIKQVYFAGGAFVKGYLFANRRNNNSPLIINGRGVLSQKNYPYHYPDKSSHGQSSRNWYKAIDIDGGAGHYIEGITLVDGSSYYIVLNADNSVIDNVKINGFNFNNDGLTLTGNNIKLKNSFIRDNDDAVVLYTSNSSIDRCVFWQLKSSVIQLGWYPHSMSNNSISNSDVIHMTINKVPGQNSAFITAMNALASKSSNTAIVEGFNINNIRFDTPIQKFIDIAGNRRWNGNVNESGINPWVYKNFTISNIYFKSQSKANLFNLKGYSSKNPLSDFKFSNIYFDGKKIADKSAFNSLLSKGSAVINLKLLAN